jgi:hypothetical protein
MIRFILFCGLMLHIAVAIWNGFFGPSLGAEGDALRFHEEAIYYSNNLNQFEYVTGWIYAYGLGILYRIFTDHLFFGSMTSVMAWLWSAIVLLRIMKLTDQSESRTAILIAVFSFWPSILFNTSVTLRESFEALAVALMAYSAVKLIYKNENSWTFLISGMVLGSVLHGSLVIFSIVMFSFIIYYNFNLRIRLNFTGKTIFALIFLSIGLGFGIFVIGNVAYNLDKGLFDTVQSFNEYAANANARADYRASAYFSGPIDVLIFIPITFFEYMMEPLPNHIGSIADAALFLENIARAALLFGAISVLARRDMPNRSIPVFLLSAYLFLSLVWAVGTVNWGTASRHHVPGFALLLLAAFFTAPGQSRIPAPRQTRVIANAPPRRIVA